MATNGTVASDLTTVASQTQASGRAIFWALASIALNAMLQPSFTGHLWSGDTFKDSMWPHRSSPFICLVDAVADIWIMVEKSRKPGLYSETEEIIQPTALTMRLAIFVLGVLPQVIKLFSSTGIPITQTVAAVFVFATMASMVRTTCSAAPMSDVVCLAERALWTQPEEEKGPDDNDAPSHGVMICWAATIPHVLALTCIWERIFRMTHICTHSTDANNILQWTSGITTLICSVYLLQHAASVLATGKWYIPRSAPLFLFGLYTPVLFSKLLEDPSSRRRQMRGERFNYWIQILNFLAHAAVVSYAVALVLELFARWLLRLQKNRTSADVVLPTAEPASDQGQPSTLPDPVIVAHSQASNSDTVDSGTQSTLQADEGASQADQSSTLANVEPAGSTVADEALSTTEPEVTGTSTTSTSASTPVTTAVENKKPSYFAEKLGDVLCCIAVVPLGLIIFISAYIGTFPGSDSGSETDDATERGEADGQQQTEPATAGETPGHFSLMSFLVSVTVQPIVLLCKLPGQDLIVRPVVKVISLGVWRIVIAGMSMYGFAFNWVVVKIKIHIKDRVCVAFGILNVMTAMIMYLAVFEARGTYAPAWTSLLGR